MIQAIVGIDCQDNGIIVLGIDAPRTESGMTKGWSVNVWLYEQMAVSHNIQLHRAGDGMRR